MYLTYLYSLTNVRIIHYNRIIYDLKDQPWVCAALNGFGSVCNSRLLFSYKILSVGVDLSSDFIQFNRV